MVFAGGLQQWVQDSPDHLLRRSPNFILVTACSALFLDITNLSAITIALPTIQQDFNVSTGDLQWVLSGYALTFGAFLLVGGRAGDLYSRVMLVGMGVFALFTLACALAPNFVSFIVARAFQGIGASLTVPSAQAHIPIYFSEPKARSKALGVWGATGSVAFVVGLIIGGVLTSRLSWRWIFWISLIFSGVLQIVAILTLPHSQEKTKAHQKIAGDDQDKLSSWLERTRATLLAFDVVGVCMIVPALLLLTYALSSANASGWASPAILSTLILSIVLMIAFTIYESRIEDSLVPTKLFNNLNFDLILVVAVLLYAIRQASTYFLTLQLQSFGNSPLETSLLFLPMGIASFIVMLVLARLLPILGARVMLTIGWLSLSLGILFFSFNSPTRSFWTSTFIAELICPIGIGSIGLSTNFVVITMAPREQQGAAAGILNVALQVGGSVVGLSGLTAVADGIGKDLSPSTPGNIVPSVAFEAVYYSCIILAFFALLLSAFCIRLPEALRGKLFSKPRKENTNTTAVQEPTQTESTMPDLEKGESPKQDSIETLFVHKAAQTGASLAGSESGAQDCVHASTHSERDHGVFVAHGAAGPSHSSANSRDSQARYSRAWPLPAQINADNVNVVQVPNMRASRGHISGQLRSPGAALAPGPYRSSVTKQPPKRSDTLIRTSGYDYVVSPSSAVVPLAFEKHHRPAAETESEIRTFNEDHGIQLPVPLRLQHSREPIVRIDSNMRSGETEFPSSSTGNSSKRRSWRNSWKGLPTPNLGVDFGLEQIGEIIGLQRGAY